MIPAIVITLALLPTLEAKSWCAYPLVVHEWGVQVYSGPEADPWHPNLPTWFYRGAPVQPVQGTRVRDLPADGGERDLPVLHFYGPLSWDDGIPAAVEVGFARGTASVWYPQVDRLVGPSHGDPLAAQLAWDALTLTNEARGTPRSSAQPWLADLRAIEGAMWVNRGSESERFLFYEAQTAEQPVVRVEPWSATGPGVRVSNQGAHPVYDLVVIRRDPVDGMVGRLDKLDPGEAVDLPMAAMPDPEAVVRPWLLERLVDADQPEPELDWTVDFDDCVMMRDPAVPVSIATGHGLFRAEAQALLDLWAPRFFGSQGTSLLYREDPAALDAMAPLAVYTDMRHFLQLHRSGLVFWAGLDE